ncbi:phage integrase-like protein [Legionella beliardensis]|uniref:Phage integrase-like protein n=1 Tax=Legionella beliardensis TaxID=91822 RepID=A0A378I151_9GAMM|nr:site-specific integrase [Legionella beliardensis]STX28461.1 phage integrase-like protein [Legionella beliardensis]
MKFIDSFIKNLKPESNWYEKIESSGLGIRVMPGGSKSWIYRFTLNGKRQKMTLGKYPALSLKQARELLFTVQGLKEQGINPIEHSRLEKLKDAYNVEKLINDWYNHYVVKNRKKPLQIKQQIEADIIPLFGHFSLNKLQPLDISNALDIIVKRGAPIQANRVLSTLKQVFNYAVSRGSMQTNPASNIRARDIGGLEKHRERYLNLDEIKKIWHFLDSSQCQMSIQTRSAIKIIILTGVRTAEIRLAQWSQIDFANSLWIVPPEHNKGGITVKIHLTDLTKSIFNELREISDSPFVLSGLIEGKPLDENALPRAIRRIQAKIGIPEWTAHDLRRTFATQLGETLLVDPVVIEKCLGHKMPKIMATYNKNEMLPQRREALEKWATCIKTYLTCQTPLPKEEELCII